MKQILTLVFPIFLFCLPFFGNAQLYTLNLSVKNQPETQIVLGSVKGDDITRLDSAHAINGRIKFNIPHSAHSGIYRIILGKTAYARVMNKAPQQINFIFNKGNISLETDFESPVEKLKILHSEENKLWFDFRNKEKNYIEKLKALETELNEYWSKKDTNNALTVANSYNQLQMEWDLRANQTVQQNPELFASKLIKHSLLPILDGFLTEKERAEQLKTNFFLNINFSKDDLIYSSTLTDKVFEYLVLYNHAFYTQEKRATEYIKAVDIIMGLAAKNKNVSAFIRSYLIHGFKILKLDKVINHIQQKY